MKNKSEIIIYKADDGSTAIKIKWLEETVRLTQKQMAELFGRGRVAITQHIGNIFKERQLV